MMTSLYTGTSGLKAYGEGMSSIANNIANLNTVGFKSAMMLYSDNISASVNSAPAHGVTEISQLGLGVSVGVNRTMFQQGSLMPGNTATDIAISGKGFFGVAKEGLTQYTRAGNFRFTKEGKLIDPNGFNLLGRQIVDGAVAGAATPVTLDFSTAGHGYMPPKATTAVTLIEKIGMRESAQSDSANKFFSLAASWDATADPPLSETQYGHKSTVPVYDSTGSRQDIDVYYDYVGSFDGKLVYQYIAGADPDAVSGNGLFAAGTMTFSSNGQMEDMTMFSPPADGNYANLSGWTPSAFAADGKPAFTADFKSGAQTISLNFGLDLGGTWNGGYASASDVNANPTGLYTNPARSLEANYTTSYAGSSGTVTMKQNGYAPGYLQNLTISTDGIMTGQYNNGQNMDLYQIPVYRFIEAEGLRHEGGNRYSATTASGAAEEGVPGTENYGTLRETSLEQSTVDLAVEFATMIVTQRGFQMNSKVVTTSDQMLQKALELKR